MEWETMEKAQYNTGDIGRLRNRILYGFQSDAVELEPVFQESNHSWEYLYQLLQTGENPSRKMLLLR